MTNLDDALQDLSEVVQHRLVVLDERMRVIAYSIHESEEDRARLSHLLAHSDTWPPLPAGADGPVVRDAGDGTRWVVHPLRDDRHRVGHLLHARAKGVPAPDAAILADGAARLGALLSLRTRSAEREAARAGELLSSLLAPRAPADERERAAAALVAEGLLGLWTRIGLHYLMPLPVYGTLWVLIIGFVAVQMPQGFRGIAASIRSTDRDLEDSAVMLGAPTGDPDAWTARTAVETTLDFVARTSTATVVGGLVEGHGVLVFPRPVVQDRLERVLAAPGLGEVRAGIGGIVTDLTEVSTSHEQARQAWRAACLDPMTHPRVTTWSDLGLDKLLLRLPLARLTADDLPEGVARLLASDHREVDVPTLEAYLAAGGDARATATDLGIHRSTLYYRLTRIRTTTGADLRAGVARRDLHTGLRVARLAGMLTG